MESATVHAIIEQYAEQRMKEAVASLVLRQLTRCFGQLHEARKVMIAGLTREELAQLGEDLLTFRYLNELDEWFHRQIK